MLPEAMEIVVRIKEIDKMVRISVSDFGPGIAPEKIEHIFERYYRTDYGGSKFLGWDGVFIFLLKSLKAWRRNWC
jgi:signal transduction histidine kinase